MIHVPLLVSQTHHILLPLVVGITLVVFEGVPCYTPQGVHADGVQGNTAHGDVVDCRGRSF